MGKWRFFQFKQTASIRFQWLKAFLLIMIIAVFLNIVAYTLSINTWEQQMSEMNRSFYKQVQSKVDTVICSLEQISLEFYLDSSVVALSRLEQGQQADVQNIQAISALFADRDVELRNTYRSFLFFHNLSGIASIEGFQNSRDYFDKNFFMLDISYDVWLNWLGSTSEKSYTVVEGKTPGKHYVMFKFPLDYAALQPSSFVSVMEDYDMERLAEEAPFFDESHFFVLDNMGQTIVGDTSAELLAGLDFQGKAEGTKRERIHGETYMVTFTTSPLNEWKYVYFTPKSVYLRSTNSIKYILYGTLFFSIIVELFLIARSVNRQYSPVKKLMSLANVKSEGNEYAALEEVVRELGDVKKEVHGAAHAQKELMRSKLIANLLSGLVMKEHVTRDSLQKLDISFPYEIFMVGSFYLNDYEYLFEEDTSMTQYERYDMMKIIIINIFTEIANEYDIKVYFTSQTNTLSCIMNLPPDAKPETAAEIANKTSDAVWQYFHVHYACALSMPCSSIEELSQAYMEAGAGIEYLRMSEDTYFVEYQNIKRTDYDQYTMPVEVRSSIVRLIKQRKTKQAYEKIEALIDTCCAQQDFSPRFFRYMIYDITGQLLGEFKQYIDEDDMVAQNLFHCKITTRRDIDQVKKLLLQLVKQIEDNWEQAGKAVDTGKQRWEKLIFDIKQYIEENYQNVNLNVSMLADMFGFNPAYLSKCFKESEHASILDYINMVRVRHVKRLLLETDWTLEKIAGQTGFSNISTFNRTFKKMEGITAGEYKKYMLSQ